MGLSGLNLAGAYFGASEASFGVSGPIWDAGPILGLLFLDLPVPIWGPPGASWAFAEFE